MQQGFLAAIAILLTLGRNKGCCHRHPCDCEYPVRTTVHTRDESGCIHSQIPTLR